MKKLIRIAVLATIALVGVAEANAAAASKCSNNLKQIAIALQP